MKIVKFSHFFVVCGIDNNVERDIVRRHCIPLVHRESHKNPHGEIVYGDAVKYFYYNKVKGECHFHINTLEDFLHLANQYGVPKTIIKFEQRPLYQPAYASLPMHPDFTPKEKQVPVIDYFTRVEPHIKLCTLQTGQGKTFSYLYAVSKWAMRSMMVVRPQYFDAWVIALLDPVKRVTLMEPDRILTIQGSPELKKAIAKAKAGEFDYDFVLMANRTLFNMNKVYEEKGSTKADYGCEPWELYELLEIGILGKDEGHMDFHANYRIDLFMHVPMSITLTATFDTDKAHNAKMQLQQHPLNTRAPDMGYIKYIRVIGYRYRLSSDYELRHKLRGRSEYNHNQLEESILKNKKARKNYLGLITEAITQYYLKRKTDSLQKLLILCGRVDMVEAVVQHIDEVWDDVTGARYVSGDSLPEVIKSDIIVTTIISGKAAIDIPNLITTVNTVNVGSKDTNEQALGRTRELKAYPGLDPMFIYFYTEDIPAAYNYHLNKRGIFIDKVLSMDTVDSGFTI